MRPASRSRAGGTTARECARSPARQGSTARLIGRYFGSKEGLFTEVVEIAFEKSLMMTPERNAEAARDLLTGADERPPAACCWLCARPPTPAAAAIMRDNMERNYQRELAEALPGPDATARAALLVAICSGVLLQRLILGSSELNGLDVERLVPYLRAALDAVAAVPDDIAASPTNTPG